MLKTPEHLEQAKKDLSSIDSQINGACQGLVILKQKKRDLEREINNYSGPEKSDETPEKQDEKPVILDESIENIPELDAEDDEFVD